MRGRDEDKVTGDCINAVFQGFFDKQALEEQQTLEGLGIVIDDEFNFMMSHWRSSMLNGESFIRTSCGNIIYGAFEQNSPVGMVAIHKEGFKIFLNRVNLKNRTIEWYKDLAVFDQNNSIFYLLEISKKDDQQTTIDPKISLSETSRYDKVKVQWKVKIIQRCPLKLDGTPTVNSKAIKRFQRKIQYSKGDYTPKEQNQINLLSSTLGNVFQKASFITARTYLKDMAKQNPNIILNRYKQSNEQQQTIFLSLSNKKSIRQNEKQLGVTMSLTYDYVKCLGAYNKEGNLNGLGVQYRKNGQSFVGIFKQNILSKQYKYNSANSKNVSTYPIRELLIQEHLKSLNYVHNSIYLSEISMVTGLASKITKYIQYFEKELEKRNINYNDTPSNQSIASQFMNIYKYVDLNREKYQDSASSRQQLVSNVSEKDNKKPGFIMTKSNNKSAQKSPTQQQRHSPSPAQSKSPLRNVRIQGKIYHEGGRSSKQLSYSRQYAKLKLNQATYKRENQY